MIVLSRSLDWGRRSKSTERGIEDKHNTPITETGNVSKKKVDKIKLALMKKSRNLAVLL